MPPRSARLPSGQRLLAYHVARRPGQVKLLALLADQLQQDLPGQPFPPSLDNWSRLPRVSSSKTDSLRPLSRRDLPSSVRMTSSP